MIADFSSEVAAEHAAKAVLALAGGHIDHVVSSIGFATVGAPVSQTTLSQVRDTFETQFYPNFIAAKAFLPLVRDVEGATYTLTGGGLAYGLYPGMAGFWLATVKNAAVNGFTFALQQEIDDAKGKARANTLCIFFGVPRPGSTKNQFGMDSDPNAYVGIGKAYVRVAQGEHKGKVIDFKNPAQADSL